jgi:hypothetical protein
MKTNELNFDEKDHRLIMIQFMKAVIQLSILLCSKWYWPYRLGKMYGIKSLKLDSKYLIPQSNIWREKEIKNLKEKIKY